MGPVEQKIVNLLTGSYGRSTWGLAAAIGMPTPKALRVMKRLERDGVVIKCGRYTSVNNYVWVLNNEK